MVSLVRMVHLGLNLSSSTRNCECVVDGSNATVAYILYLFLCIVYCKYVIENKHSKWFVVGVMHKLTQKTGNILIFSIIATCYVKL